MPRPVQRRRAHCEHLAQVVGRSGLKGDGQLAARVAKSRQQLLPLGGEVEERQRPQAAIAPTGDERGRLQDREMSMRHAAAAG